MLPTINNLTFNNKNYNYYYNIPKTQPKYTLPQLHQDTVSFSGKSPCDLYKSVFDYMAAEIFDANKAYHVDGSLLNVSKIGHAIKKLFDEGRAYLPYKESDTEKIKWKSYIPQDVRQFSIDKINEARQVRMAEWQGFLTNPERILQDGYSANSALVRKIKSNPSLRFVIWHSVSSELKANNRHLPVPFDDKALLETINGFEQIAPKDRKVRCASPSFLEIYTHRLRDNLLMSMGKSGDEPVWIKIPSIAHDKPNKSKNIRTLEILSNRNWCTRSSVDKAEAALEDGDFYIYLKRGKSELWEPLIGMTTAQGKIDQIQGVENNNIITLNLVDEVKSFIKSQNLKLHSGVVDEGPKAYQAIMISEKLNEPVHPDLVPSYTLAKAIKLEDEENVFRCSGVKTNVLDDGKLEIGTYKPSYCLNPKRGITVPYSMFGIDENVILRNVRIIDGDLILDSRSKTFESRITKFPPNLEKVTGKISCTQEQYNRFKPEIDRLLGDDKSRLFIHNI